MNQHWQATGLPGYDAQQQLLMLNNSVLAQWTPVQSPPLNSHLLLPMMYNVISPHVPPLCYQNNPNVGINSGVNEAGIMGQVWPPIYHPPNSHVSVIKADTMTVQQTAEWIRTLGRYKQWKEADKYADSFAQNHIWGYLLQKLTNEALLDDLGIAKYGHRLVIMFAIKDLFSLTALPKNLQEEKMHQKHDLLSPMSEFSAECGSAEDSASSVMELSQSMSRMMDLEKNKIEAKKWSGSRTKSTARVNSSSRKVLLVNYRRKGVKASPTNPLVYRTLRKVKLRSGKSGLAKDIGFLPKGSVVVINQTKGRSGRVVFQEEDGSFKKAGWVTLYTDNKQPLLKKCTSRTKCLGFTGPSAAESAVK